MYELMRDPSSSSTAATRRVKQEDTTECDQPSAGEGAYVRVKAYDFGESNRLKTYDFGGPI